MNKWLKHDGSIECPVDKEAVIEVETWTPNPIITKAYMLHWKSVKFYRVIEDTFANSSIKSQHIKK